jgi:hypothetical protein
MGDIIIFCVINNIDETSNLAVFIIRIYVSKIVFRSLNYVLQLSPIDQGSIWIIIHNGSDQFSQIFDI